MALSNTKVTDQEVEDVINDAHDNIDQGTSRWPSMTYEQGVADALNWVIGERDEHPFEEN
ncbi:hypothetical protein SEA_GRASSBOY_61 [Microbacterium phage Grassboy]|nr:hypothetical protein SEA_GRASSBOY_61 [Microbacterium phage Grassboy]